MVYFSFIPPHLLYAKIIRHGTYFCAICIWVWPPPLCVIRQAAFCEQWLDVEEWPWASFSPGPSIGLSQLLLMYLVVPSYMNYCGFCLILLSRSLYESWDMIPCLFQYSCLPLHCGLSWYILTTIFFLLFWLQANTHVNVHQDLKDVKLWQVKLVCLAFICILVLVSIFDSHIYSGDSLFVNLGSHSP